MVAVGKRSYSLYLWHWPVFCLVDYRLFLSPDAVRLPLKIAISFALTFACYRWIEAPARAYLNRACNWKVAYITLAAAVAICVPLGIVVRSTNYVNAEIADVAKGGLVYKGTLGAPSVVLMGDSNGSMYGKSLRDICAKLGCNLTVISVAAGDPLPSPSGSILWASSLAVIRATKPDYLVIANAWTGKVRDDPERLSAAIKALKPHAGRIVLLCQPPMLPKQASRASIRDGARPPFLEAAEARDGRRKTNELLERLRSPEIAVIDVSGQFESESGTLVFADQWGRPLFHDGGHLSGFGVARIEHLLVRAITSP